MTVQRWHPVALRGLAVILWLVTLLGLSSGSAFAHDIPGGSELVMGDWVFYVFLIFGLCGLAATIVAYKMGLLFRLEEAKYPMMLIPEDDYYTPDWALEEDEEEVMMR